MNPTQSEQPEYHSYLLRLWREHTNASWRVLLQNVRTGEQRGFGNIQTLLEFLAQGFDPDLPASRDEGSAPTV